MQLSDAFGGGHWGILETYNRGKSHPKPQSHQKKKPHLLSKLENPKTALDKKTEKPLLFSTKA